MKRPGRWDLLGHADDPIDADLYEVNRQATHYSDVSDLIVEQAARLRAIGAGDNDLIGKYAENLRRRSGDLAGDLDKTHGRYAAVGSALKSYAPALDEALTQSWSALRDAEDADAHHTAAQGMANPTATPDTPLTEEQQQQVAARTRAIDAAQDGLNAARTRLDRALDALDDAANAASRTIRDSFHDGLTDGFWDKVGNFLVKFTSWVVDVAGWIAIGCAIVMLFIPGLDVLATIALYATLASLLGHTALAATGNGSWFDVALDAFALVTFGLGKWAAKGLSATEDAVGEAGIRSASRAQKAFNQRLNGIERRIASGSGKARLQAIGERAALSPRPVRAAQLTRELQAARSSTGVLDALQFGGDLNAARDLRAIQRARELLPNSGGVTSAASRLSRYTWTSRIAWPAGLGAAGADKYFGGSDVAGLNGNAGYIEWKEDFLRSGGAW